MEPGTIGAAVAGEIVRQSGDAQLTIEPDTPLFELGILDSVGLVNLVAFIEDTYDLEVADEELVPDAFANLAAITEFVDRKLS